MFYLPRTLPADVRALLEKQLEDLPLDQAMNRVAGVVLRLFNARESLFLLHRPVEGGEHENVARLFLSTLPQHDKSFGEQLMRRWCENGVDRGVTRDLEQRLSCISFSAFSWPYGTVPIHGDFTLPQDYTLLLPVSSQFSVRQDQEPEFLGYFALFFDCFPQLTDNVIQLITQLPATLSDLILAYLRFEERNESEELSEFAHDMKRTLLLIEEQLHSLRSCLPENSADTLSKLDRSVKRMIHHSSAVLLADRVQFDNLKITSLPMSINEVVTEAVANFGPHLVHSNVELRIELAEHLPLSPIDPSVFPTVIENLLENSIKHSGPGTCLYLRTRQVQPDSVRLEVMDNGKGIPEAEWDDIFLKRYRGTTARGSEGNGLGLYLVRKIVEAHKGNVFPSKSENMNTCFIVDLPTVKEPGK